MKGGGKMKEDKKISFWRLTWKKILLTLGLLIIFLGIGFICGPSYVDPIGTVSSCKDIYVAIFSGLLFLLFQYHYFILLFV